MKKKHVKTGLCQCGCGLPAPIAKQTSTKYGWVKGQPMKYRLGHNGATHRMRRDSPELRAYYNARYRCNTRTAESWPRYGGRGIKFKFTSFEQWYKELGPRPSSRHSVHRIENDGHYEPGNVEWALPKVQSSPKNQRRVYKHRPDVSTKDAARLREQGLSFHQIARRLKTHKTTIARRLVAAGLHKPRSRQVIDTLSVVRLYRAGNTMEKIAKTLGIGAWAVWSRLHKAGVVIRPTGPVTLC